MSQVDNSNKRIAKNTLMLYFRMLLIMGVGLFTSRIILDTLGVSDYGIFNVVGGFVTMLAYLNAVFVDASQRFISFSLGENDLGKLKKIFSTSIVAQMCLALFILMVAETLGLWFVNCKLNIPPERMIAANWVYQCSVVSLIVSIFNIPYRACVVAHEQMHIYAYISIVEAIMKLAIVYLLVLIQHDKLILYAILHLIVTLVIPLWFMIYCRRHFEECHLSLTFDKSMFKEMFSFSGWVLVGNLGFTFKDQLSNVIMNLFLGTTINAARGVAAQLNGVMITFANNFFMAISPQITKTYASGDSERNRKLVYSGTRLSFFLMLIITIPVVCHTKQILELWLVDVPQYSCEFVVITLLSSVFFAMSKSLTTELQATGDIKAFQIGIAIIMLTELPIAYVVLALGMPPYIALLPAIATNFLGVVYRFSLLQRMIKSFDSRYFYINVVLQNILLYAVAYTLSHYLTIIIHNTIMSLMATFIISLGLVYFVGLSHRERQLVKSFANNYKKKINR